MGDEQQEKHDENVDEEHEAQSTIEEQHDDHVSLSNISTEHFAEAGGDVTDRPRVLRTVTTTSRAISVVKVPRAQSTGLLGRLTLIYEAEEPHNYPRNIKWLITFWIAVAAITAPMGSSIIYRKKHEPFTPLG